MRSLLPTMVRRHNSITASHFQLLFSAALLFSGTRAFAPVGQVRCRPSVSTAYNPFVSPLPVRNSARKHQTWLQTASIKPASVPAGPTVKKSVISASALVVLEILFRRLFQALSISFPSSLAGCGVLFVSMLALPFGDRLYNALSPGSALLAKWLPVFFVPSLITLPLADGLGSAAEVSST